jgi:GNAT superfamily N-acetyltransferase
MALSIRPARVTDAGDVARLTGQLGYELAASDAVVRLARILSRPDQQFLVADVDGHPIGWLHATMAEFLEAEPFVVIAGLVVDDSHRRKGIGRQLVRHAEEWAAQRGCSIVRLWSSAVRTQTHQFYERLGYTNIKTQYSFVKPLDGAGRETIGKLVPRVDQ